MDVEIYMKAAQASDMRKRANIAMTGIWSPEEILQFVAKKNSGANRQTITTEHILILQSNFNFFLFLNQISILIIFMVFDTLCSFSRTDTVMKMQSNKRLDITGVMDLTNLRKWMSYHAKMARSRTNSDDQLDETEELDDPLFVDLNDNNQLHDESSSDGDKNNSTDQERSLDEDDEKFENKNKEADDESDETD